MSLLVTFLLIVSCTLASPPYDCTQLAGTNSSWMQVYRGVAVGGTCLYHWNGTLVCYTEQGIVLNTGTYKIVTGDNFCIEYEYYDYVLGDNILPEINNMSCNVIQVNKAQNITSMVGCSYFDTYECPDTCDGHWINWFSAIVWNYLPK